MRIIGLVNRQDHVSGRYRLKAFQPYWERMGHSLFLRESPKKWYQGWRWGNEFAEADAVILQRRLLDPWKIRTLRRVAKRLIFDFDDAVFLRDSHHPKGIHCEKRMRRFQELVKLADLVVGGNRYLLDQVDKLSAQHHEIYLKQSKILIPTCVDTSLYLPRPKIPNSTIKLAWIGSASTLKGLKKAREILEAIGAAYPQIRLKLICDRSLELDHLPVDFCRWSQETETRELAQADIGVSWLPDDDWSRGKCGLKVLQYLAAGLPVVANPVGVQLDIIRPGVNGFLATTPTEWVKVVGMLLENAHLRHTMGQAGRDLVEKSYDVQVGARLWLQALQSFPETRTWRKVG